MKSVDIARRANAQNYVLMCSVRLLMILLHVLCEGLCLSIDRRARQMLRDDDANKREKKKERGRRCCGNKICQSTSSSLVIVGRVRRRRRRWRAYYIYYIQHSGVVKVLYSRDEKSTRLARLVGIKHKNREKPHAPKSKKEKTGQNINPLRSCLR